MSNSRLAKKQLIPVYIVKDKDCMNLSKSAHFNQTNPVFKYAAIDNQSDVLLVQAGADGRLYTTGPT